MAHICVPLVVHSCLVVCLQLHSHAVVLISLTVIDALKEELVEIRVLPLESYWVWQMLRTSVTVI